jgi:hypothetical protein
LPPSTILPLHHRTHSSAHTSAATPLRVPPFQARRTTERTGDDLSSDMSSSHQATHLPHYSSPPQQALFPSLLPPPVPRPRLKRSHSLGISLDPICELDPEHPGWGDGLQIQLDDSYGAGGVRKRVRTHTQDGSPEDAFANLSLAAVPAVPQVFPPSPPPIRTPAYTHYPPLLTPNPSILPVTPPMQQGESHHSENVQPPLIMTPDPPQHEEDASMSILPPPTQFEISPNRIYVTSLSDSPPSSPPTPRLDPIPRLELHPLLLAAAAPRNLLPPSVIGGVTGGGSSGALILYKPLTYTPTTPETDSLRSKGTRGELEQIQEEPTKTIGRDEWDEYRREADWQEGGGEGLVRGLRAFSWVDEPATGRAVGDEDEEMMEIDG